MLVVISDLHFRDGTATDNIPPNGFVRTKDMSYVVLYDARSNAPPGYVASSGAALG